MSKKKTKTKKQKQIQTWQQGLYVSKDGVLVKS